MSGSPKSAFERCALASRLLSAEQLIEAKRLVRQAELASSANPAIPYDQRLADKLVEARTAEPLAGQAAPGRPDQVQPRALLDRRLPGPGRHGPGLQGRARESSAASWPSRSSPAASPRPRPSPTSPAKSAAQAKLDHPNLVRALDAGEDGNVHYLVTEYVPGTDLRKLVRRNGPLGMAGRGQHHLPGRRGTALRPPAGHGPPRREAGERPGHARRRRQALRPGACRPWTAGPRTTRASARSSARPTTSRPTTSNPWNPDARLGHLFAGLHALLRGDRQGSVSRAARWPTRSAGTLRASPAGPAAAQPAAERGVCRRDGRHDGQEPGRADPVGGGGGRAPGALDAGLPARPLPEGRSALPSRFGPFPRGSSRRPWTRWERFRRG